MIRYLFLALLGCAVMTVAGASVSAAEVTMRLRGGELTFKGEVVSFDGKIFNLETELFGQLNLDIDKFECIAGACSITNTVVTSTNTVGAGLSAPVSQEILPSIGSDFAIHGSVSFGRYLMPLLIGGYVQSIGARATVQPSRDLSELKIEIADGQGARLAGVDLTTHGSATAFPSFVTGQAMIGMSSRRINAAEEQMIPSMQQLAFARDGLLVIVSPENPISKISRDQLAAVFSGTISNWSQLGQEPGKINVHTRRDGSGTRETFNSLVFGTIDNQITANATNFKSDIELANAVARDRMGIGFTSFASKASTKALAISSSCGITYSPNIFDIKTGVYPLTRDLFLYTSAKLNTQHTTGIVSYASSVQAQGLISEAGFINKSWEYQSFKKRGDRMKKKSDDSVAGSGAGLVKQMIQETKNFNRLSVTYRFRDGTFELDDQSRGQVQRLAVLLASDKMRGRKVLLLGFSDAAGTFEKSREQSVIRANVVKRELLKASAGGVDKMQLDVRGYGELLPDDCNDNRQNRARNRRVEIWIDPVAAASPKKDSVVINSTSASHRAANAMDHSKPEQTFRNFIEWQNSK